MREQMTQHRANPVCASCHAQMDELGFALENFDAIGEWRDIDAAGSPIDASAKLPDGTKFTGPAELRKVLLNHSDDFLTTLTEKLLTYALGRGLEAADAPAIRQIKREASRANYRLASLIQGIVTSTPFQMRMAQKLRATERCHRGVRMVTKDSVFASPDVTFGELVQPWRCRFSTRWCRRCRPVKDVEVGAPLRGDLLRNRANMNDGPRPRKGLVSRSLPILKPLEAFRDRTLVFTGWITIRRPDQGDSVGSIPRAAPRS